MSNSQKTQSNDPQPKSVSLTPSTASAPAAPSVPDFIAALPEGAPVFVLVPNDDNERRHTLEQLEDALFKYFEIVPATHHELKAARLPFGSVILAAHCVETRAKRADGTFGQVHKVHIAGPIALDEHRTKSQDGYTFSTDLGKVVDAITQQCAHRNGYVWMAQLSGDPIAENRVVKLIRC